MLFFFFLTYFVTQVLLSQYWEQFISIKDVIQYPMIHYLHKIDEIKLNYKSQVL